MEGRQLCGAIAIVVAAVFLYAARDLLRYAQFSGESALSHAREETDIAVELAGDPDHAGIYFLPQGSTVANLLHEAGVEELVQFTESGGARIMHAGDRITCDTDRYLVTVGEMEAVTRLALALPIDLNRATREDLMLISGIGPRTAAMIIETRERRGSFSRVDELEGIVGIGKNRYDGIRRYLYVKGDSSS